MLHSSFNTAQYHRIDESVLEEVLSFSSFSWTQFPEKELIIAITKCNNYSAPGPNKISWYYLKYTLKNKMCLNNIINITNSCFDLDFWPSHFKISTTIVIPKFNKTLYNTPKLFRPIVLLNTLGKLIEKVISDKLQFHMVLNNFIY